LITDTDQLNSSSLLASSERVVSQFCETSDGDIVDAGLELTADVNFYAACCM
jgi:hypothetical protein